MAAPARRRSSNVPSLFSLAVAQSDPAGTLGHAASGLGAGARCQVRGSRVARLAAGPRPLQWDRIATHRRVLAVGVDNAAERARLIRCGFGDALASETPLAELAARLLRLAQLAQSIPCTRRIGPVRLDLFRRDGEVDGRPLALHPREFALLWRLAETPGLPLSREELLADIWRLRYRPGTNSLEVHISRLRAKLAAFGIRRLVETHPEGGYCIGAEMLDSTAPSANGSR